MTWMNQEQRALAKRESEEVRNEAYRKAAAIVRAQLVGYGNEDGDAALESAAKAIEAEITE